MPLRSSSSSRGWSGAAPEARGSLLQVRGTALRLGEPRPALRAGKGPASHAAIVLHLTTILFCDCCDASTARSERGWRAWIVPDEDGEPRVTVACPACAERCYGEDEARWAE